MSIPFALSHRPFALVNISYNGETFLIRIVLDIVSVLDGKVSEDSSPQLDVSFRFSAIAVPSSSRNPANLFPMTFSAQLSVKAKSANDGKTYEMFFDANVLSVEPNGEIDLATGMPQVTTKLSITPSPMKPAEDGTFDTFNCVYCGHVHPRDWYTVEHIIPQSLNNKNYVLNAACRRINNFMAHSFEKRIMQFELIKEILFLVNPPRKPVFRDNLETSLGVNITRWVLPSGKVEFAELPKYSETNYIQLSVKGRSGENFPYSLKLPFLIKSGVSGIPRMIASRHRHSEDGRQQITKYLTELSENPSIDKDFEKFLQEIGGTFTFKEVSVVETASQGTPIALPSELAKTMVIDNETLFKLFLKIAWTHAVRQFGIELLSGPIAKWILDYLATGYIEDNELIRSCPALFTNPVKIEDEEYVFWKYGLDETLSFIMQVPDELDRSDLLRYHKFRYQQFESASRLISFNAIPKIDDELRARRNELCYHNLSLKTIEVSGRLITACCINLFGKLFEVKVQLSDEPITENYPPDIRIDF